ncbi:sigma-54-dependent Fis family transcriptional regulator [Veronia nyctiphanis]|uniref:sigma-54-dependent Fis family transcriptional regulator n=1 Tax=Veronia nyctiphanis TaxID=1278244 RepID=UPI001F375973|nr:sigma 54-interacting transcriptional regulator [Veronia nyctiphanis]
MKGLSIEDITGIAKLQLSAHPERVVLPFVGIANYRLFAALRHPVNRGIKVPSSFKSVTPSQTEKPNLRKVSKPISHYRLDDLDLGDKQIKRAIVQASSIVNSDIPLLIQGETGSGKEIFAQAFHRSSERAKSSLVAVNCAAIPSELVESELFGYVRGAFTGANNKGSSGYIREAHGGTLFLDEIGDMPLRVQARLLRVLQEKSVTPLGTTESYSVDFRLVCATHHSLREGVKNKTFREDLYYRVNGLTVFLPSLRNRSDLTELVKLILIEQSQGGSPKAINEDVLNLMNSHRWPGNLRQLANVLRVSSALAEQDEIHINDLPDDFYFDLEGINEVLDPEIPDGHSAEQDWRQSLPDLYQAMEQNITKVANIMGVSRNTIYKRLKELGIK